MQNLSGDAPEEVQSAHANLLVRHKRVTAAYDGFDKKVFDYCKEGLAHYQFHPKGLPKADQFLPLALFGASDTKLKTVQAQAQRKYSGAFIMQRGWHTGGGARK